MDKKEIFRAAMAALNVKPGDVVRVISAWPDCRVGWTGEWNDKMDSFIDKEHQVVHISRYFNGVQLETSDSDEREQFWFPPYVLRKVPAVKAALTEKEKYSAAVKELGLVVGDTVTVTGRWPSHCDGWDNVWIDGTMDKFIGKKCVAIYADDDSCKGTKLELYDSNEIQFRFPPYVLRKVPATTAQPMASEATLTDEFAKAALTALMADLEFRGNANQIARIAYVAAKAMVEQRQKVYKEESE